MLRKKTDIIKGIKVEAVKRGGRVCEQWFAYLGTDSCGKAIRISRSSKPDIISAVNEYLANARQGGESTGVIRIDQAFDAKNAIELLRRAGIRVSLCDAIQEYIERHTCTASQITVGRAYYEFEAHYDRRQTAQLHCVHSFVGTWVEFFGPERKLSEITAKEFSQYVATKGAVRTRNNIITNVKTFLNWCCASERKYLEENPLGDIRRSRVEYKEPEYAKVEDVAKLFAELKRRGDKDCIAYGALAFFCGIRFEEIVRLADEIETALIVEQDTIRIARPKGYLQGMRPRVIHLPENAKAWLAEGNYGKTLHLHDMSHIRLRLRNTAKELGIDLAHNVARHSFITYHVAAYNEPSKTEGMAGTSATMRAVHYMGLATKTQGEAYFAIRP